jgi:hypothetical protein
MLAVLAGCACVSSRAPSLSGTPATTRGAFEVVIAGDTARISVALPEQLDRRWIAVAQEARKRGEDDPRRRGAAWIVSWDSTGVSAIDSYGTHGFSLFLLLNSKSKDLASALAVADHHAYWTEPAGSIDAVVLSSSAPMTMRVNNDRLEWVTWGSAVMAPLVRNRPDSLRLWAELRVLDTTYVLWTRPRYLR